MTTESKLLGVNPSGDAANVEDVFSTFLYTGTSAQNTITNNIDLAGEGGMVWVKDRDNTESHYLWDTERGATKWLRPNGTNAEGTNTEGLKSFSSTGFVMGTHADTNASGRDFASWTFRKAPKFFDVVTYTGNGASSRQINHDLDATPALIMVKVTSQTGDWNTIARISDTSYSFGLELNTTKVQSVATGPSSTVSSTWFVPEYFTGSVSEMNASGVTYVAYLFADNTAEDVDDQMIKCGSFTTNSSGGATVNLGWQPQFLIFKIVSGTADSWYMFDTMRDFTASQSSALFANTSAPEASSNGNTKVTSNGFDISNQQNSVTYIYMAVRAPMMDEPEAATDVFKDTSWTGTGAAASETNVGFSPDILFSKYVDGVVNPVLTTRLCGVSKVLSTSSTAQEVLSADSVTSFDMDGASYREDNDYYGGVNNVIGGTYAHYFWKRAKGFFDVVPYTANSSEYPTGQNVPHSLGVVPEMMWVKSRSNNPDWVVYHSGTGNTTGTYLNVNGTPNTNSYYWNDDTPTATEFTLGGSTETSNNTYTYIAYLFATLAGISKVGSYTGNGSYQTINCGFAYGSRFILIKRTSATGDWYYWDSVRGIVSGNDPHLSLNTTAAQVTTDDSVDPDNSGFIVNQNSATNINVTSATYIFYAIA